MIVFALRLAQGTIAKSTLVPAIDQLGPASSDSQDELEQLVNRALQRLVRMSNEALKDTSSAQIVKSATFGGNDPFTLTWLLETLKGNEDPELAAFRGRVEDQARDVVGRVLTSPRPSEAVSRVNPLQPLAIDKQSAVDHAFPLLRTLQLAEALKGALLTSTYDVSGLRDLLFQRIHYYLSQGDIGSADFDPADLVFSLEAWLLCTPVQPQHGVLDRAFDMLNASPTTAPSWRPQRPFKVTAEGLVLLPQSVEVANSLLRISSHPSVVSQDYFARYQAILDRYLVWLESRLFRGFASPTADPTSKFSGWESEHTYAADRVHLWQTSQALIFLQTYAAVLQQSIARTTLRMSGLRPAVPEMSGQWSETEAWEPMGRLNSGSPYRIYERMGEEIIKQRRGIASVLLFGPPGTGKSTTAEQLAAALHLPFVTVTPSDFIAAGSEAVEARAKALFDVLAEQRKLCIFFDEIDNLLLDRDSALYRNQSDIFQLLTPGMLTKLARLTKAKRLLVIVATNYYERIDRAIKRPGRLDLHYLVLPPDAQQRRARLAKCDTEWESLPTEIRNEIVDKTVRFTYKELDDLIGTVTRVAPVLNERGDVYKRAIVAQPAMCTLEGYAHRVGRTDKPAPEDKQPALTTFERPLEEISLVAKLELEATKTLSGPWWLRDVIEEALERQKVRDQQIEAELRAAIGKLEKPGMFS
jgi:hypothetical protein